MEKKEELVKIFAKEIREVFLKSSFDFRSLQEIRLRVNAPLIVIWKGKEYFLSSNGELSSVKRNAFIVSKAHIQETMEYVGSYSLYAFEEEIRQGFLTIQGGHRVGVAGKIVMEGEHVKSLKYISFLNVRLSHQVKGCADLVMPYIRKEKSICHTLIISPPRCGKTTLLRDMIRQISTGTDKYDGKTVGVVDERSEIGGAYLGVPQNDLGIRTDVLDCCPKADGMLMLLRSMSPEIIAVDEIGDYEDVHAIEYVIHCGCKLLATVHGSSIQDIERKPLLKKLVKEKVFERYVILHNKDKVGKIKEIFDERGTSLYHGEEPSC